MDPNQKHNSFVVSHDLSKGLPGLLNNPAWTTNLIMQSHALGVPPGCCFLLFYLKYIHLTIEIIVKIITASEAVRL